MRALGLMSGTSLDGIDAALVDVRPARPGYTARLETFTTVPFDDAFRARLLAALPPQTPAAQEIAALDRELGARFAAAARALAAGRAVDYVASHGLTLVHAGDRRLTMQIGEPYAMRDTLGASVIFDFRRADCSAGGEGAPLVPYVDALLFGSPARDVVALNLGGIANVTVLPRGGGAAAARAWDTGPANMLLDAFVAARTGGRERCDRDGAYAARGRVHERVVNELVAREAFFLALPPPKSTGRERFGAQFLAAHADLFDRLSLDDGCATLCGFTVATIASDLEGYAPAGVEVVGSGGGMRNRTLVALLRARLAASGATLVPSSERGVDPDAKEALAFAVLGYETLRGRPANLPGATGAARPAILGAIAPHEPAALLAKVRNESAEDESAEDEGAEEEAR